MNTGLTYGLLFDHGKGPMPAEDRFSTTAKIAMSSGNLAEGFALPEKSLEREKIRKFRRDISLANEKTTEARIAGGHVCFNNADSLPLSAVGRSENLPVWGRRKL